MKICCRKVTYTVAGLLLSLQLLPSVVDAQSFDPDCYYGVGQPKDPAPAKCCIREATIGLTQMRTYAMTCGARAADLDQIDSGLSPSFLKSCSAPIQVNSQLDAFSECSRVYYCGKLAMECVKERTIREGVCRLQFASDCMINNPIPN